ncbi:hypothetical protein PPYR_01118 [Photinus pyralis]|uniref:Uncharacterized protein n=1 Tax=Photinus pyralis TaxID=7054 RepID=A0A5N4B3N7_PHOPY|nr:uncharacterized protein LOC116160175 [Photinus pyralis]KAB0804148.1 hypothetical protein PPYR_01118 [Photinus pyralis]
MTCRFFLTLAFLAVCLVALREGSPIHQRNRRETNTKANNEEFEKFFLKASKSVPRIGRRGSSNDFYPMDEEKFSFFRYPFVHQPKRSMGKGIDASIWADIDTIFEFNPQLPRILEYLSSLPRDRPQYDALHAKLKSPPLDGRKELLEYRLQEEV